MAGWLRVASSALGTDEQLAEWIGRSTAYVASLPPKPPRAGRSKGLSSPRVPQR